jgi:hypothetical protein
MKTQSQANESFGLLLARGRHFSDVAMQHVTTTMTSSTSAGAPRTPRGQKNVTGSLLGAMPPKLRQQQISKEASQVDKVDSHSNRRPVREVTKFRSFYNRGDLPIAVDNDATGCKVVWRVSDFV